MATREYLYAATVLGATDSFSFWRYNLSDFSDAGSKTFRVEDVVLWDDLKDYHPHLSAFAINPLNGHLYVPTMDLITYHDPRAKNRTGIIEVNPWRWDGLVRRSFDPEIVDFHDTTGQFNYLDAIDFDGSGRLWANPGNTGLVSVAWGREGPDFSDVQSATMADSWRFLQGIRVYDGKLYAVPAGTGTSPASGIGVFSVAELIENGNAPTTPLYQYNYALPSGIHNEGFDLDPNDRNIAYVTSTASRKLWMLRLEPPLDGR